MIFEWIWAQIASFLGWLLSLFPTFEAPDWLTAGVSYWTDALAVFDAMHTVLPVQAISIGTVFVFGCATVAFAVRAFRIVLSLFTGGGGGAA